MNEETIPEDVMREAEEILCSLYPLSEARRVQRVALAILAERERAAKAAEQRGKELGEAAVGSDIANTIREPAP